MEIFDKLSMVLLDTVKIGGWYGALGFTLFIVWQLGRIALIGGFSWAIIKCIAEQITIISLLKHKVKLDGVSLLSDKVSKHIKTALDSFQEVTLASVKELEQRAGVCETKLSDAKMLRELVSVNSLGGK